MICEKCWSEAARMAFTSGKTQTDCYIEILERKQNNPCSWVEQLIGHKLNIKAIEDCIEIAVNHCDTMLATKAEEALFDLQTLIGNADERMNCHVATSEDEFKEATK